MPRADVALTPAEQALRPLDELRAFALRLLAARSAGRPVARSRDARVSVLLTLHALAAFAVAVVAPSFLLAITPLVFGVPHLAADVRYLLVRRSWPRWWLVASGGFATVLIATRIAAEMRGQSTTGLAVEQAIAATWIIAGAAAGFVARRSRRGGLILAVSLALAAAAVLAPRPFRMALLHGHNLVALVVWLTLFRRRGRSVAVPAIVMVLGALVLAAGPLLGWTIAHGWLTVAGLHLFAAADWLAPGLPDGAALALTTCFAFLQAVHYLIWLVGIPAADRPGDGGRSWRAAWRELRGDLRGGGLAVVVALTLAIAGAGLLAAAPTRRLFLSIGSFHAWLELAVLAYVLAQAPLQTQKRVPNLP